MRILWHGMVGTCHSWALTQIDYIRGMKEIGGHEVFIKSTNNLEHFPEDLWHMLVPGYHGNLSQGEADYITKDGELIKVSPQKPLPEIPDVNVPYDLEIAYTIPFQGPRRFRQDSKCRAIIWNFESSILPPGWEHYHRSLDYILPSSKFSYDIFADNGIPKDKMLVVPHGVDTNVFNPDIPPFPLKTKKKVKLLHCARAHHRKLHDRVIKGYLDTFTGNDDICLVMKTEFLKPSKEKIFEVDVKKILTDAFKGRKNPPEIEIITDYIPHIGSLYTACDAVVSMSSTEGFCLLPDTIIDTACGPTYIKNMCGDGSEEVYTHKGNVAKVSCVTKRATDETIFSIRRANCDIRIEGTGNHPYLAVKRNGRRFSQIKKLLNKGKLLAEWVGLEALEKGDFAVIPKNSTKSVGVNTIDIGNDHYISSQNMDENSIWLNNSYKKETGCSSLSEIAKHVGCSFQYVSEVINGNSSRSDLSKKVLAAAKFLNYKKPTPLKIPRIWEIDEDLAKFFGLYIAEGSISSGGNSFNINLHSSEKYGQEIAKRFCKKMGIPFCEIINENRYQLSGSSKIVSNVLSNLLGNSFANKRILTKFYNSKNINHIIGSIFYGDGSACNGKYSFSTSSLRLCNDIFHILLKNNIFSSILTDSRNENNNYILTISSAHNDRFFSWANPKKYSSTVELPVSERNSSFIESKDYFIVPIRDINKLQYKGYVYNLEVDSKDHSYTSFGTSLHNCLPLLEALACEKLVIAPRHGGQLEFLNDDNSLLVDTGEMKAPASHQYWVAHPDAVVGDPDIKHYKKLLRETYENIDEEKQRVKEAAAETVKKFNWKAASQLILDLPIPEKSKRIFDKRRIAYIVPYAMVGGGEVWIREAISRLDRTKYDPHVILVSGTTESFKQSLEDLDVTVEDLSGAELQFKGQNLKALIESSRYDILHFYNSFGVYNTLKQVWDQGVRSRVIETVHSDLVWGDSMAKVSARYDFVSGIISVSNHQAKRLLKAGNKNIFVVPQQVDWDKFDVPRSKDILDELNIPKNFVVGYVGRLSKEKNIQTVLQCAQMFPNASFVIVGDGPLGAQLKQLGGKLSNVFFVGARDDVEKFYSAFDVLLLPSEVEGLPLVILEAMMAGTPIVASDVGAISEVVSDGVNGFLNWNIKDPRLFAAAIAKLQDSAVWEQCSRNSKASAEALKQKGQRLNINHIYNALYPKEK